jgi:hypothetical protein
LFKYSLTYIYKMYPFTEAIHAFMSLRSRDEYNLSNLYNAILQEMSRRGTYMEDAENSFYVLGKLYAMPKSSMTVCKQLFPPSSKRYQQVSKMYTDFCQPSDIVFCKTEDDICTLRIMTKVTFTEDLCKQLICNNVNNKHLSKLLLCSKLHVQTLCDIIWDCMQPCEENPIMLHHCILDLYNCDPTILLPNEFTKLDIAISNRGTGTAYTNSVLFRATKYSNKFLFKDSKYLSDLISQHGCDVETLNYLKPLMQKYSSFLDGERESLLTTLNKHIKTFVELDKNFLDTAFTFEKYTCAHLVVTLKLPFEQKHMPFLLANAQKYFNKNERQYLLYILTSGTVTIDWWIKTIMNTQYLKVKDVLRSIDACLPLSDTLTPALDILIDKIYRNEVSLSAALMKYLPDYRKQMQRNMREGLKVVPQLYDDVINIIASY